MTRPIALTFAILAVVATATPPRVAQAASVTLQTRFVQTGVYPCDATFRTLAVPNTTGGPIYAVAVAATNVTSGPGLALTWLVRTNNEVLFASYGAGTYQQPNTEMVLPGGASILIAASETLNLVHYCEGSGIAVSNVLVYYATTQP